MRGTVVTTAVILAVLLLGVDVGLHVGLAIQPRATQAQAIPGGVVAAAANTQNEAFCFLYNPQTNQLAAYRQRSKGGMELTGIRLCASDFNPAIVEYPKSDSTTAVRQMKNIVEQQQKRRK